MPGQNYKTDEDMWKLVSPPCGVKGEGAFAALFAGRAGCERSLKGGSGGGSGAACGGGAAPVVLFDEIEEARADFMTSALVNAIDHRGFVEYTRKLPDGRCETEQPPTAGSFIILTSNCFMSDLADVLAAERRPGRDAHAVYAATRRAMDARIFDDGVACDEAGTASPFASRKMRDRMRGNLYPFLPLTDDELVRAFEQQLHERAEAYAQSSTGVRLYWTAEYARLIVATSAAAAATARMRAMGLAGGAASGGQSAGAAVGAVSASGRARRGGTMEAPSLRKRIEQLMRLDERSVEKLYARGAAECARTGRRLESLVLHTTGEDVAEATPTCTPLPAEGGETPVVGRSVGDATRGGDAAHGTGALSAHGTGGALPTAGGELTATLSASPPPMLSSEATTSGGGTAGGGGESAHAVHADIEIERAVQKDAATDAATEAALAQMRASVEAHVAQLQRANEREAALHAEVDSLRATLGDLQTQLQRWQLLCAALALVALVSLAGAAHLLGLYAAMALKATMAASAIAVAVSVGAFVVLWAMCQAGSPTACTLQQMIVESARWALWALRWAWELASVAWGALGGWRALLALGVLVVALRALGRRDEARRRAVQAGAEQQLLESERARHAHRERTLQAAHACALEEAVRAERRQTDAALRAMVGELRRVERAEAAGAEAAGARAALIEVGMGAASGRPCAGTMGEASSARGEGGGTVPCGASGRAPLEPIQRPLPQPPPAVSSSDAEQVRPCTRNTSYDGVGADPTEAALHARTSVIVASNEASDGNPAVADVWVASFDGRGGSGAPEPPVDLSGEAAGVNR